MKIFTNDFLYQGASSVNCLPATRFFLEKMKVKIMNHEKCCNHGPWFLCFSLNPPPRENYWNHGQWPWSFSLLLLFLTWKCFLRGPAVLHHRAVRNAASETARPVKASKELYLLKRYKCHRTPVYLILNNCATNQVKYKHRLLHNTPTNTQLTGCWWQVIPATAPQPPSPMAPQFSTGEGESWSWLSGSSWSWSWS